MNWGNLIDWAGTELNLPEMGASELFTGGKATTNTGRIKNSGGFNAFYNNGIKDQAAEMTKHNPYTGPAYQEETGGNEETGGAGGAT